MVSYYHHHKHFIQFYEFEHGRFDDFFDMWLGGQAEFGDYYHFVNSWLAKGHLPNVFIITYEYMKEFPADAILQMADFMDEEKYGKRLRQDEKLLQSITHLSSVPAMKKQFHTPSEADPSANLSHGLIRKGVVNDWKNLMSEEQNQLVNQRFKEEAEKNPLLMKLWHDYSWLNDPLGAK